MSSCLPLYGNDGLPILYPTSALAQTNAPSTDSRQAARRSAKSAGPRASEASEVSQTEVCHARSRGEGGGRAPLLLSRYLPLQSTASLRRTALRVGRVRRKPLFIFHPSQVGFAANSRCLCTRGRLPLVTRPRAFDSRVSCLQVAAVFHDGDWLGQCAPLQAVAGHEDGAHLQPVGARRQVA